MTLAFSGIIGIGKTTRTGVLANYLGSEPFYESVDDNPILDRFYEDPKQWGFSLQIYFLNHRFQAIKKALRAQNNILDRSIYEDLLLTKINNQQGNISDIDYDIYKVLVDNMMEELEGLPKKAPDLLIYLTADFDTVLQHIRQRGRSFEQCNEGDALYQYYRALYDEYDHWFDEYHYSPKIKINVDNYDIIQRPQEAIDHLIDEASKVGVDLNV